MVKHIGTPRTGRRFPIPMRGNELLNATQGTTATERFQSP